MAISKNYGPLGVCTGIKPSRTAKILDKIKSKGYVMHKPKGKVVDIPAGCVVCVPISYYAGVYGHFGISLGGDKVIDYGGHGDGGIDISKSSYKEFSYGEPSNVRVVYRPRNGAHKDKIIARAMSRLGEREYNFFTNNCEHFAWWSVYGREYSHQVNNWLSYILKRRFD